MGIDLSLYKIADALQVPVECNDGIVSGKRTVTIQSVIGLAMKMQLSAKVMFASSQVGVVFGVSGNLLVLVAHNPDKNALSFYIIDKSCLEYDVKDLLGKKATLREAVEILRPAIVKSFYNTKGEWKTLTLPK